MENMLKEPANWPASSLEDFLFSKLAGSTPQGQRPETRSVQRDASVEALLPQLC